MRSTTSIAAALAATLLAWGVPASADDTVRTAQADDPDEFAPADPDTTEDTDTGDVAPAETTKPAAGPGSAEIDDDSVSGYFRVDTDSLGTQFWFGAVHNVAGIDIATDIYVVGTFAEFDIGPSLSFGNLALTPMIGIGFDFGAQDVTSVIAPQLFTVLDEEQFYFESWVQFFFNDLLNDPPAAGFGSPEQDSFYTRNFVLYKLNSHIHVGPQIEIAYQLNDTEDASGTLISESGLSSLPIGGRFNLGYGKHNTLGVFLGYDIEKVDGTDGIAGRFTFIRTW